MKINYGLVGLGEIAKNHLLGIRNMPLFDVPLDFQVNLSGVFTTHLANNYEKARLIGFKNIVDSMEKLVQIPDLDVVDICTPNYLHKEQVLFSVKFNKHVYCEKPLGMNSVETSEILGVVKKSNIKNQVAFVMRFMPAVAYAHAILNKNFLGSIYAFRGEFFHSSYLNPDKKISWRLEKQKSGGGALVDLGIHMIDLVRFLIGEIDSVSAFAETVVKKRQSIEGRVENIEVDDWALLTINLCSGARGTIEASRVAVGNEGTRLTVYGDKGSLRIDLNNPYLPSVFDINSRSVYVESRFLLEDDFYSEVLRLYPNPKLSQGFMVDVHLVGLLWFLQSVARGKTLFGTPTFEEAHRVQLVIDAAYKSATEGNKFIHVR
jgi:predicted dehydrogenase